MKYKKYSFWTSLAASLVVLAGIFKKILGIEISSEIITDIVMGFAGLLVVLGFVKMPKEGKEVMLEETLKENAEVEIFENDKNKIDEQKQKEKE